MIVAAMIPKMSPRWTVSPPSPGTADASSSDQHNVTFRHATVTGIDWARHTSSSTTGTLARRSTTSWSPRARPRPTSACPARPSTPSRCTRSIDAIALRNHIIERFEAADADPSLVDDGALTFVIVGGGPTGVEVSGAMSELFAMVLRKDFRALDVGKARVVLVEMADVLLQPFSTASQRHARGALEDMGVEVRTRRSRHQRRRRPASRSASARSSRAHTLVWAAGVQANPLAATLGVPTGRAGRIVGRAPTCAIAGHDEVFAIGDVAAIPDGATAALLPLSRRWRCSRVGTRPHEIVRAIDGRRARRSATATRARWPRSVAAPRSPSCRCASGCRGTPAWLAWLGLHLVTSSASATALSVFLNWAWNYLTWDRGPRLILRPDREPEASP